MNEEYENNAAERIRASKDFPFVQMLITRLRDIAPASMTTAELAVLLSCSRKDVYGYVKIARRYAALTNPGECFPNKRAIGYRRTFKDPRAWMFESIKSGNRADGHLRQELNNFNSVDKDRLKTVHDQALYIQQQARVRAAQLRLATSEDMKALMLATERNVPLVSMAAEDAKTPWQLLGFDDHDSN